MVKLKEEKEPEKDYQSLHTELRAVVRVYLRARKEYVEENKSQLRKHELNIKLGQLLEQLDDLTSH